MKKRGNKTPLDWVIFSLSAINLLLAGFWAYRDFEYLTTRPLWYIHLIAATILMGILIVRARSRIRRQQQATRPSDENIP